MTIDSRTLRPGDLFFAIVGDRHDGHRFVRQAFEKGALGVVVSTPLNVAEPPTALVIEVRDTTRALQDLAMAARRSKPLKVVGITGSVGKTTTKEATAAAVGARFDVLKSEGNLNNLYGLPLSLLKLENQDVAVLEMGMSAPGEIARLTEIARPDVGVLLNVAEVHREFFPSLEAIASAKGELFSGLGPRAVAVVNADDPLVLEQARRFRGRQIRFGLRGRADLRARGIRHTPEGLRFIADFMDQSVEVKAPLFGAHHVQNLLAALGAAEALDVPLPEAARRLERVGPAPHRGERLRFRGGPVVIDETYNSNPAALRAALAALVEEQGAGRRIAVLGDMLELGERAETLHRESGRIAAQSRLSLLIGVGTLGAKLIEGASAAGMPSGRLVYATDAREAAEILAGQVRADDVVLVKASRAVALEKVLAVLEERFGLEGV